MKLLLNQAQINEVLDTIQGSCMSLEQAIAIVTEDPITGESWATGPEDLLNEDELHAAVDNAHFICGECGWWCEVGDYAENQDGNYNGDICSQCEPESEED